MTPSQLKATVIDGRTEWVRRMLALLRGLPLSSPAAFLAEPHTPAAAESYLRRSLEALFDLARHMLSKGFGLGPGEYKQVASQLVQVGVLDADTGAVLRTLAGYRNRMAHFYDEIDYEELYAVCAHRLGDIEAVLDALLRWVHSHPELVDHDV